MPDPALYGSAEENPVSKYEERAFQIGKGKSDLASLKNQLARLKEDLGRFVARKPDGSVVAPLRERIRELEAQIADADRQQAAARQSSRDAAAEAADDSTGMHSTAGRIPPRRR
jgi:hypothetical protein